MVLDPSRFLKLLDIAVEISDAHQGIERSQDPAESAVIWPAESDVSTDGYA